MKVLLIGNGARENALAWLINKSPSLTKLYVAPGNPGIKELGDKSENIKLDIKDKETLERFSTDQNIDLVVIGPEQPLADGLSDWFRERDISVFGPSRAAARLESSKSFAKEIMSEASIPTAKAKSFTLADKEDFLEYISNIKGKIVLKADGLAAGKGVMICENKEEAAIEFEAMTTGKFGSAGDSVLVEEYLEGVEISVFAVCDGKDYLLLPAATDHKRAGEGDTGLNTGGMGAFAPTPYASADVMKAVGEKVVGPLLTKMNEKGEPFIGCLFCGLMLTEDGPKVIEYNVRFGDPEIQAVSQLIEGDFLKLLASAANSKLEKDAVIFRDSFACNVVLAADGYPESYPKGMEISGYKKQFNEGIVFHAGTRDERDRLVTSGGRVISCVGVSKSAAEAISNAYLIAGEIEFEHKYYRRDIAKRILEFIGVND